MKKISLLFLIFTFAACGFAQVNDGDYNKMLQNLLSHSVPEITVDSLSKVQQKVILLDAREWNEFKVSAIKNAKFVGFNDFNIDKLSSLPKNSKIVVYCSVGYRSEKIAEKLLKAGYTNVSNLYGGIFEWVNQDKKVYQNQQEVTKVHAYDKKWGKWLKKGEKIY